MEQNLVRFFIIDLILFGIENFLFQIIKSLQFSSTSFYIFKVEHMYMEEASYIYILKLDYSRIIFKIKKNRAYVASSSMPSKTSLSKFVIKNIHPIISHNQLFTVYISIEKYQNYSWYG